jgi:hypothetical protein
VIDIDGSPVTEIAGGEAELVGPVILMDGVTEIDGGAIVVAGVEFTDINGTLGRIMSWVEGVGASSGRLMIGMLGRPDPRCLCGLEILMVGAVGVDNFCCDWGSNLLTAGTALDACSLSSVSFGFQLLLKLTIGLPGLSETIEGVGNFGLRSLRLMLVALRMSSLRISFPSFIFTSSLVSALVPAAREDGIREFLV